jgi:hypothetical protein
VFTAIPLETSANFANSSSKALTLGPLPKELVNGPFLRTSVTALISSSSIIGRLIGISFLAFLNRLILLTN